MSELIKVADAWERERRGNNPGTYIVAVAGGMKFLLLRKKPERPPAYDAERGRQTAEALDERTAAWSRRQLIETTPIPSDGDEIPF
jgi:hypothetical protein